VTFRNGAKAAGASRAAVVAENHREILIAE